MSLINNWYNRHVLITLNYTTDIKQLNDSELDNNNIKDMNVAFLCDADNVPYLQCTLVLVSVYSNVIVRVMGGNNNSAVKEVNSCHKSSAICNEDDLNFTADEHLNHKKIITRNFSINSTCPSDKNISSMLINSILLSFSNLAAAKDQWHWIMAVIIVILLSLFAIILVSILGMGTVRKIRYIIFYDYHLIVQYYENILATWVLARDTQ